MVWRFILLIFLIPCIYGVFGWYISSEIESWSRWLIAQGNALNITLTVRSIGVTIDIFIAFLVIFVTLGLTLFSQQMSVLFNSWFKSDFRAIASILGWSLAIVVILRWLATFSRILILLCAIILGRLELQQAGYNRLQIFLILSVLCLSSFAIGVWAYSDWGTRFSDLSSSISDF